MQIQEITELLEKLVPLHLAEDYDNVGLLVGNPEQTLTGILVSLDVTEAIQKEAMERSCNLIVSHHPIWFRSRKNLLSNDFVSRQIKGAIERNLNLYACHTNLDNLDNGVNRAIVSRLGLRNTSFLEWKTGHGPDSNFPAGSGMIGLLPEPVLYQDFLEHLQKIFSCKCIRYRPGPPSIQRVAVCGGAGDFLLYEAMRQGADAFLTGEVGYHHFFDADGRIFLADLGHYESEQFSIGVLENLIRNALSARQEEAIPVLCAQNLSNPVQYLLSDTSAYKI